MSVKEIYTKHFLLHAALNLLKGSKAEDFAISQQGLSLHNKVPLTWGNFVIRTEENSETIAPLIPAEENLNAFSYQDKPNYAPKFYLFFTALDKNNNYIKFNELLLTTAIYNRQIILVNFLTGEEYTLGASSSDK